VLGPGGVAVSSPRRRLSPAAVGLLQSAVEQAGHPIALSEERPSRRARGGRALGRGGKRPYPALRGRCRTSATAREQPQAAVESSRLLSRAMRARSSSVSALSRWTSRSGDASLLLSPEATAFNDGVTSRLRRLLTEPSSAASKQRSNQASPLLLVHLESRVSSRASYSPPRSSSRRVCLSQS
jgi:hypothetical protein